MRTARKVSGRLEGRWFMAGALFCALVAAVTVAVEPLGQPAGAATQPDPPAAPTGFTAVLSGSSVSLSWTNPGDASISSYEYRYKIMGSGAEYGSWTQISGGGATTTSHTISVSESGRYNVQLRARNTGGEGDHAVASTRNSVGAVGFEGGVVKRKFTLFGLGRSLRCHDLGVSVSGQDSGRSQLL